ncbi:carbohydrate-binding module family 63 protein [Trematosphaeria pertusa]|uniref:Carbohydrate-binding module family 63 protein n=1 Tax=Trematosphaeria pertusa TaxID=390896 RepID=A0A6A6IT21_9PLEO|nr:carbohydrate-binding module family 63 protein [Trematosphaeria pertusa]KAF2253651.1 carbohydrate-binding module family 63 protein [Trematosphaeria pertusa]
MKSFVSILPLAAFAAAADVCTQRTVTQTEVNTVTVTVPAVPSSSSVAAAEVTETVYVTHSAGPQKSHHPHQPHFSHYPFPNGTSNYTAAPAPTYTPTTLPTVSFVLPSSVETIYLSPSPVESPADSATAAPSEPAAIPTSEAAVVSSAAPATPSAPAASDDSVDSEAASISGTATFYGGNIAGGHCSFSGYTLPSGIFGTAYGGNWDASECGACVSVTGPNGNSIKAMIVDQCPECDASHLDLFQNAFTQLAPASKGVIDISYAIVPCGITSPIILKNKEGTSPYWFSMQVMNSNVAISKFEVSTDGGSTWKATTRQPYNFFENASGFGTNTVDVKVTSVNGQSITVKGVSVAASSTKTASSNFS